MVSLVACSHAAGIPDEVHQFCVHTAYISGGESLSTGCSKLSDIFPSLSNTTVESAAFSFRSRVAQKSMDAWKAGLTDICCG